MEYERTMVTPIRPVTISASLAAFFCLLDIQVVNVSLPEIAAGFHVDASGTSMVVVAYTLALSCTLLTYGKLGDRLGARRLFLLAHALFLGGALACSLAPTLGWLIGMRFVQGVGGGGLHALAYSLISERVPREQMGRAFGLLSAAAATGLCLGAPLGGLISGLASWRYVFALHVPLVGLAMVWLALRVAPDPPRPKDRPRFDAPGAFLCMVFVVGLVLGLQALQGGGAGWRAWAGLGAAGLSAAALAVVERRQPDPVLDFSLFSDVPRALSLALNMAMFMLMAGVLFMMPFELAWLNGLGAAATGLVMMAMPVLSALIAPFAGRLSDRVDPARVVACGVALCLGCLGMLAAGLPAGGLVLPAAFLALYGAGHGLFVAPVNTLVLGGAPEGSEGTLSGTLATMRDLGSATGASVFALFLSTGADQAASPADFRHAWIAAALLALCAAGLAMTVARLRARRS